ncbi:MAG: hypothetical protein NC037_02025 [Bacteroides sp.]|nr:hypothetical protein [Bacillota bacterium]MCM1393473.1 hypothetical protein [[Eubacterium] siraeum]MCM1455293.1 hypothetical protein [Bacteroides sp.]
MEKLEKTCSCFGHKDVEITDELRAKTAAEIDRAIADGVRIFLFGGLSDFDDLCYDIVTEKKNANVQLNIKRIFCFPLDKHLHKPPHWFKRKDYEELTCPKKSYDYWYPSIYFRNIAMIDESDWVLFYAEQREKSGAYKAYEYAKKKRKHIVNLTT